MRRYTWAILGWIALGFVAANADEPVDYNRDVRPLLSNTCFRCHGPDEAERKGELRLDRAEDALEDRGGYQVVAPGKPAESELVARVTTDDADLRMPPPGKGPQLKPAQIELLRRWIEQGAPFAGHWSYQAPLRPELPAIRDKQWPRSPIDHFVLAKLERAGVKPTPAADRYTMIRRLSLDLTGLPPSLEQVDRFVNDRSDTAYEDLVDRLLESPHYGERWAAMWLDLARYADSAGYANDPPRTIWLYRDWVIRALNDNMPFDQFTIRQLAGDLLPDATDQDRIATAFHRNTLTNSEGGTNDEEFRNVAVVDRVNTTMQVWMGTTIGCAQCHHHKYDPISQEEYFQLFAFFNNTEDADRADETPLLSVLTEQQQQQRGKLQQQLDDLKQRLIPSDAELTERLVRWEKERQETQWRVLSPLSVESTAKPTEFRTLEDGSVLVSGSAANKETYRVRSRGELKKITALRLEALPDDGLPSRGPGRGEHGAFVLSELRAAAGPQSEQPRRGRYVRIELPGQGKMIHVAEVQVQSEGRNIAAQGKATQSSTGFEGPAELAIDGRTDGDYAKKSVSHTAIQNDPWWEVDLGLVAPVDSVVVWNRTDNNLQSRLDGFTLSLLDESRRPVWSQTFKKAPQQELTASLTGLSTLALRNASASFWQADEKGPYQGWKPEAAIDGDAKGDGWGWAVGPRFGQRHAAVFELERDLDLSDGVLQLDLVQQHALGRFRVSVTSSPRPVRQLPLDVEAALAVDPPQRSKEQLQALLAYIRGEVFQPPKELTDRIAALEKQIAGLKPVTVPILRELADAKRRKTHVQIRGNFMMTGEEVHEGTPKAFHAFSNTYPANRLGFAQWLVDRDNPLTPRVVVNRYWEQLFGSGLVSTSEDFGVQGELPSHPRMLDWLAAELVENAWDVKTLLRLIATSATYRQSSAQSEAGTLVDPANQQLSRGPRFRLSAEMVRDQALAVSGLLSPRMYGPSVQPPRPKMGLRAAFGGSTDWETSPGENRYRRALYTSWRRSLPYPSMATFDAPARNVCTIRRGRTNTPLQALVTLNDPVYVEAAQALARRMVAEGGEDVRSRAGYGLRLCLARPPREAELNVLAGLFERARERFVKQPESAAELASDPIGPVPAGIDVVDLAAWTVVGNVLLNMDETLAKR